MKYLQSDLYPELLKRNKIKIHIETGHIFFDHVNSNESIYSFFLAQQDHTKKLLNIVLETSVDYKYLLAIKYENEYDMLTHDMLTYKNSKFLFYNFNKINQPVQFIRHTKISYDDNALTILLEKN